MKTNNLSLKSKERILYEKPIIKGVLFLALPLIINSILRTLNDFVDNFFIARAFDIESTINDAIAGMNVFNPIYSLFIAIGTGLGIACVAIVSQNLGAGNNLDAKKYSSKIIFLMFCAGGVLTGVGLLLSSSIMMVFGLNANSLSYSVEYARIRSIEYVFIFVIIGYQAIRQAEGKTFLPSLVSLAAIIINFILTWLFVHKLGWDVRGAAWSTVISYAAVIPVVVMALFFNKKLITISFKEMFPNTKELKTIFKLSIPAALAAMLNSLGFVIIQALLVSYGISVASGFGFANKLSALLSSSLISVSSILASYVGNNIGNNNVKRAKESYYVVMIFMVCFSTIIALIAGFTIQYSLKLLMGNNLKTEVFEIAKRFGTWLFITQPLMAVIWCDLAYFNGAGKSLISFILSMVRLWIIRIPLILILKYGFSSYLVKDYDSVWIAMMVSNIIIIVIGAFLRKKVDLVNSLVVKDDLKWKKD